MLHQLENSTVHAALKFVRHRMTPKCFRILGGLAFLLLLIHQGMAASPLNTWQPRYASGDVNGVEFVDGSLWFLTSSGQINHSADGASWVMIETGQTNGLRALTKAGEKWVAVGDHGTIISSPDGRAWMPHDSGTTNLLWDIVARGDKFVAVGNNGTILVSPDGASWQARSLGLTNNLRAIVADPQQFVIAGRDGTLLSSPDGEVWTSHPSPTTDHLYGLAWGDGQYVAVGANGTVVTSPDGANWVRRRTGGRILFAVAYGQGQFAAVGVSAPLSARARVMTSTNGVDWTERDSPTLSHFYSVTHAGDRFVAGATSGTIVESRNGSDWEYSALPGGGAITGAAYGNNAFVAVRSNWAYRSTDGVFWTVHPTGVPQGAFRIGTRLAFVRGEHFITAGQRGTLGVSPDGKTWKRIELDTWSDIWTVNHAGGLYFAAGEAGFLASSPDAVKWTIHRLPTFSPITSVAWGNGRYMALSMDGHLMTSRDARTWTLTQRGSVQMELAFGNGRFVVIGPGDSMTLDGITFERGPAIGGRAVSQLLYGDGLFIAVDSGGIRSSIDGLNWTSHVSPSSSLLNAVGFGADRITLVGNENRIWQSLPITPPPLTILSEPNSVVARETTEVLLTVGATGQQPLSYTWHRNGAPMAHQTNSWLELENVTPADAAEYTVTIRNAQGSLTSQPATVEVEPRSAGLNVWHLRHSTAEPNPLLKLALSSSLFAAIDARGRLRVSADGWRWREQVFDSTNRLTNVRYAGNGRFIAVGEQGTVHYSVNGIQWFTAPRILDAPTLNDVTWANNLYVAVGDGGAIFTSPNLINWQARPVPFVSDGLNAVTYGSNLYIAVGDNGAVLTSPNGSTWALEFAPTWENLLTVTGGNPIYIGGENEILLRRTGGSWRDEYNDQFRLEVGTPRHFTMSMLLGGTNYFAGPGFLQAVNGGNWSSTRHLSAITGAGSLLSGVGEGGAIVLLAPTRVPDFPGISHLRGIASSGSMLVAVGRAGAIQASTDGIRWAEAQSGTTNHLAAITYAHDRFVAVGEQGTLLTSSNGLHWSNVPIGLTNSLTDVVGGPDRILAVGPTGAILQSQDGVVWNGTAGSTSIPALSRVAYGAGRFIGVDRSSFWVSTDGTAWERHVAPVFSQINSIAYGRGMFAVLARPSGFVLPPSSGHSIIFSSADGVHWSQLPVRLPAQDLTLRFADNHFIAIGPDGRMFTSNDLLRWVERSEHTTWRLYDAVGFQNTLVVVGDYGTILQTDPLAGTPPRLVSQPVGQRAAPGSNVTLQVDVSGTLPFTYQWRLNGVPITGATNAVLALANLSRAEAGCYEVQVTNPVGTSVSDAACVAVESDEATPVLLEGRLAGEGRLQLIVTGASGVRYEIQFAEQLSQPTAWQPLATLTLAGESITIEEAIPMEPPARFYRAVLAP